MLHLNKGDDNTRGHIGTELNNKAETVLQITKSTQDGNISEVKAATSSHWHRNFTVPTICRTS